MFLFEEVSSLCLLWAVMEAGGRSLRQPCGWNVGEQPHTHLFPPVSYHGPEETKGTAPAFPRDKEVLVPEFPAEIGLVRMFVCSWQEVLGSLLLWTKVSTSRQ